MCFFPFPALVFPKNREIPGNSREVIFGNSQTGTTLLIKKYMCNRIFVFHLYPRLRRQGDFPKFSTTGGFSPDPPLHTSVYLFYSSFYFISITETEKIRKSVVYRQFISRNLFAIAIIKNAINSHMFTTWMASQ